MKNWLLSLVWSIFCGWLLTRAIIVVDAKTAFSTMYFFPSIVGFIHGLGLSVKMTCFIALSLFLFVTGLSKFIGKSLLVLIGFAVLLFIVAIAVILLVQLITWAGAHL